MKSIKKLIEKTGEKRVKKIGAGALALAVLVGSFCWEGITQRANAEDIEEKTETEEAMEKEYPNLLTSPENNGEMTKEETAYVIMDADGSVTDTLVTEWLRNGEGQDSIEDVSTLKDIENTANNSTFTQDGNVLVWDAKGADIKYRGTPTEGIPVNVYVSYYLDGEKMSASEIAGKSGNVEIRFTYNVRTTAEADGYTFSTPYVMASGLMLDDEHFTDISVEGGKVIDDGSRCICLGLAFPDLQKNLNADISSLDIPESVSIKAYTDNFGIDGTYSVALTGMFADMDLSGTGSIEEKINELEDAMDKLGSAANQLVSGAGDLADGASQLLAGANKVEDGASQLESGANTLHSGLTQISGNSSDLNSGAKKVFESLLNTAETQLKANEIETGELTISNYKKALGAVIDSLDKDKVYSQALEQVTAEVEKNRDKVEAGVTDAVKQQVNTAVTEKVREGVEEKVTDAVKAAVKEKVIQGANIPGITSSEAYDAAVNGGLISEEIQKQIDAAITQQMASDTVKAQIAAQVEAQMAGEAVKSMIESQTEAQMASDEIKATIENATEAKIQELINENMNSEEVQKQLAKAAEGAKSIIALKSSLDDYNAFYLGVLAYTGAVDQAASGAGELAKGAEALSSGTEELAEGAAELAKGSEKLYDGMDQFNRDGIKKLISSLSESDIEELGNRLKALADASSKSSLLGGKADGMSGESRIIYRTASVKAE